VKPFPAQARIAIEAQGTSVVGTDGELETPLIDGKDCAYVIYDGKTSLCGIEQAYQGAIDWKKPVSVIYILFALKISLNLLLSIMTSGIFVIQPVL
jgi:hypothetical protein